MTTLTKNPVPANPSALLRNLAFLCIAGAAGCVVGTGKVSSPATSPVDLEVLPKLTLADGMGHAIWYAPVVAHHDWGHLPTVTAGYEWHHVDANAGPLSDYEMFAPLYTAPPATKCARWYPRGVLHQDHAELFPVTGYASIPESKPWVMIESAGWRANYGGGMWVLLPNSRVFVLDTPSAPAVPAVTAYERWYPSVVLNQDHASLIPTTGYAWTSEGKPWDVIEPAGSSAKLYGGGQSLWMTDSRVLVLDTTSPGCTEPSSPCPVTRR